MQADADIVRTVLRGDREAFAALVTRHERAVWATAWSVLRDDHAAADAGQEAFLQAFHRLGDLRQPEQFGVWLLRIARREAIRLSRKRAREPSRSLDDADTLAALDRGRACGPTNQLSADAMDLLAAVARLPEHERLVVVLRYFDGHSVAEIARAVGRPVNQHEFRGLVLAEADGPIHEITVQERQGDGTWRRVREIQIEYDVSVPAERVAARLPAGARVVDRDESFQSRYPLEKALRRVEMGGLILAVHDLQPLVGRDGLYVVSSVRGTPEFLKAFPPHRRLINPEVVVLDVAFQSGSNSMEWGRFDHIKLGGATRDGVEFSWWLVVPRKFFKVKDGKRVHLPESDQSGIAGLPGRLDDLPGAARVPLSATYWDEKHRDANGTQQRVSTWTEVALPPDRPPATIEEVAARARQDLLLMGIGGAGGLYGVAADTQGVANNLRGLTCFAPEAVSDADFAAAVRRGLDDMRDLDEVRDMRPEDMPPPQGNDIPKR